ncbi:hypothetical protein VKT23_003441 [Stygiomarasmius scandens]|uniref:Fungal-type protein kinase domain-containing protein n=1 Tax=Marasmiellus scandens TaxID=2682957 RepID=A0ABR1JX73_9AGAR
MSNDPSNQFPKFDLPSSMDDSSPTVYIWNLYLDEKIELKPKNITCNAQGDAEDTTTIIRATRIKGDWEEEEVVVKLRVSTEEQKGSGVDEFVNEALEKADELGEDHAWVKDHLPKYPWCKSYRLAKGTPQYRLVEHLSEDDSDVYEGDFLCITVQAALRPLTDLRRPREYAQVFFDILQIHKWLVDHPKILHRNINIANIMFHRKADGTVRGVLKGFDLACGFPDPDPTQRPGGARPFMSLDLLDQDHSYRGHEYRYDLEALCYVILIICCHYEKRNSKIQKLKTRLPYGSWFSSNNEYRVFFDKVSWAGSDIYTPIPITPFFKGFDESIQYLRSLMWKGKVAAYSYSQFQQRKEKKSSQKQGKHFKLPFDWQTLDGKVSYETFREVLCRFDEQPLVERYHNATCAGTSVDILAIIFK